MTLAFFFLTLGLSQVFMRKLLQRDAELTQLARAIARPIHRPVNQGTRSDV
jgi:hypothetical protein